MASQPIILVVQENRPMLFTLPKDLQGWLREDNLDQKNVMFRVACNASMCILGWSIVMQYNNKHNGIILETGEWISISHSGAFPLGSSMVAITLKSGKFKPSKSCFNKFADTAVFFPTKHGILLS